MELRRIRRVHRPVSGEGRLGSIFLSLTDTVGLVCRRLIPVTVSAYSGKAVRVVVKKPPDKRTWTQWHVKVRAGIAYNIVKVELASETPLQKIMGEVTKILDPGKLLAAQMDLDGHRQNWINPALVESEDFQGLLRTRERLNNGCNQKGKVFFQKLARMYAFGLGLSPEDPERLFAEIEYFRRGFEVWL